MPTCDFPKLIAKFREMIALFPKKQASIEAAMQAGESALKRGDYKAAFRIFGPLAEQGDEVAQYYLKLAYERGKKEQTDFSKVLDWYRNAAELGLPSAQFDLGYFYLNDNGIPQKYDEAFKWIYRAAIQGYAAAQFALGLMYRRGLGVKVNFEDEMEWCQKAANQGLPSAQSHLGQMYTIGSSVPKDYVLAYMWLNLSASKRNKKAVEIRDRLEKLMTPQQMSEAQNLTRKKNLRMKRSELPERKQMELSRNGAGKN